MSNYNFIIVTCAVCLSISSLKVYSNSPQCIVEMRSFSSTVLNSQWEFTRIGQHFLIAINLQHSIITKSIKVLNVPSIEEQYIIEFARAKWSITRKGREIIRNAAKKISSEGISRVLIVGHADQKGSPEYNLRLSRRRSEAVLKALLRENVSSSIIKVESKGEFDPSVPVGDDDLEARNRRVVIHVFK